MISDCSSPVSFNHCSVYHQSHLYLFSWYRRFLVFPFLISIPSSVNSLKSRIAVDWDTPSTFSTSLRTIEPLLRHSSRIVFIRSSSGRRDNHAQREGYKINHHAGSCPEICPDIALIHRRHNKASQSVHTGWQDSPDTL